jgi:hypothetical protein
MNRGCKFAPCATINYALSQSSPYDTITVAGGVYNQTVDIEKPINLVGAGATTTTLHGTNLDPSNSTDNPYGVVYVGTTGGVVTITGFTVTNPFPYAFTSGEPMVIAVRHTKSTDAVTITKDIQYAAKLRRVRPDHGGWVQQRKLLDDAVQRINRRLDREQHDQPHARRFRDLRNRLQVRVAGNKLAAVNKGNHGTIKSPTIPELVQGKNGGSLAVQDYGNNLATSATSPGTPAPNAAPIHFTKLH